MEDVAETTLASTTVLHASMIIFLILATSRLKALSSMKACVSIKCATMTSQTLNQSSLTLLRPQIFARIIAELDQTSIEWFAMSALTIVSLPSETIKFAMQEQLQLLIHTEATAIHQEDNKITDIMATMDTAGAMEATMAMEEVAVEEVDTVAVEVDSEATEVVPLEATEVAVQVESEATEELAMQVDTMASEEVPVEVDTEAAVEALAADVVEVTLEAAAVAA